MKIGFYQFRPKFAQINANLNKVIKALTSVDADLIVLPELPFTGYYFQSKDELLQLAENPTQSTTVAALTALCKQRQLHIVTGFAERQQDRCFNSALLIGPNGLQHTYRKLHLFNEETLFFTPGDIPLQINIVNDIKIGLMVCFDWAFPEVTRTLALQGAEVICHPSNLVLSYCQYSMLTRSLENKVFTVTANRFGADVRPQGTLKFTGKSQIVSAHGELLHRAVSAREALYITEIDPAEAHDKNLTKYNDLFVDRRPTFYSK